MCGGFTHSVAGGNGNLVAVSLQSPDFAAGSAGWQVTRAGHAEFNDVTIRGGEVIGGTSLYYYPQAGAGTLVVSVSETGGTDPYGNAYNQGVWAYDANGSSMGLQPVGGQTQLNMTPAGATQTTGDTTLYAGAANAGLANESLYLTMSSGSSNNERAAAIQLNGEPADASASENILVALGAQDVLYIDRNNVQTFAGSPLKVYGQSWNKMTLQNGWTVSSTGYARYKLMPDNSVWIQANGLTPGTKTDGTTVWTAPKGYVPVTNQNLATYLGGTQKIYMRSGGAMQCYGISGLSGTFGFSDKYALD